MTTESDRSAQDVFFISRIDDPGTKVRFQSDLVLNTIADVAAKDAHFRGAIRADEDERPGRITNQVIENIVTGPAVIADLTGRNPNVYYKVALAHAAQKPLVQLIEASEFNDIPFDIGDQRTIAYTADDYQSYTEAARRATAQLEAVLANPEAVDNPVVNSLHFAAFQSASAAPGSDQELVLGYLRILDGRVQDIGQRLDAVDHQISKPAGPYSSVQVVQVRPGGTVFTNMGSWGSIWSSITLLKA